MRAVVVGAGAIGSVVAAAIADLCELVIVARGARLAALREHGLVVETPRGTIRTRAFTLATEVPPAELVLVAVKTQDVAAVVAQIDRAPVACLTNGIDAEPMVVARGLPAYGVCVMCPATHVAADAIQAWGTPWPGLFDVGRWDGGGDATSRELAALFERGGLSARALPDIQRWKRTKLIMNLGNAVDALCGRASHDSELVRAIRDEGRAAFAAADLALASPAEEAARRTGFGAGEIAGRTRAGGSTYQSLARGTPIECAYFNGRIAAIGRAHGLPMSLNIAILDEITRAAAAGVAPGSIDIAAVSARLLDRR